MLGELPVWYLFLGGCGAGLLATASAMMLCVPLPSRALALGVVAGSEGVRAMYRSLARLFAPACAAAGALLAVGVACLAVDLGVTDRALLLFLSPKLSFLSVGAWLLSAAMLAVWAHEPRRLPPFVRVLPAAALLLGLAVMTYTGLLLQSLMAVPLWDTPLLPCLFVASSLSCGLALMLAVVKLSGVAGRFAAVARQWGRVDVAVLLAEAAIATAFAIVQVLRAQTGETGTLLALGASLQTLLAGPDAWVFWGVFGLVGLAVPLALACASLYAKPSPMMPFAQAACTLVGAFAMRWSIVAAGMHPVLQSTGLS